MAFEDLAILLNTLNKLAQTQIHIPKFDVNVFVSPEFIGHPLHIGKDITPLALNPILATPDFRYQLNAGYRYSGDLIRLPIAYY